MQSGNSISHYTRSGCDSLLFFKELYFLRRINGFVNSMSHFPVRSEIGFSERKASGYRKAILWADAFKIIRARLADSGCVCSADDECFVGSYPPLRKSL